MRNKEYRKILKFDIEKQVMVENFQNLNLKFSNACLEISAHGGLFFVSKNFKSSGKQIFKDKTLDNTIMVFKSNGDVYARLLLKDSRKRFNDNAFGDIVAAKFIKYEKILCLFENGKYLVFCPSSNSVIHMSELTPSGFFGVDNVENHLAGMTTFGNSMIFWTREGAVYLIQDIFKGERTKLMDNMYSLTEEDVYIEELVQKSKNENQKRQTRLDEINNSGNVLHSLVEDLHIHIFLDPSSMSSRTTFFVFPHFSGGIWVIKWNGQSVKKERLLQRIKDPILFLCFSHSKRRLALLTSKLRVEIYEVRDLWKGSLDIIDSFNLSSEKIQIERLKELNWVKDYVLCFCYIDKVHFLVVGSEKEPSKYIRERSSVLSDRLFYLTEVDGLRVLLMSEQSNASGNFMFKIKSQSVMHIENVSSIHEAAYLYKWYQTVSDIEGIRMGKKDLRKEQSQLINAIKVILKAIRSKNNATQMNHLLKAAAFGKLYLENEEDIKNMSDDIFDMVKLLKIWNSWKNEEQRAISFKQFIYLCLKVNPKKPFRELLDILIQNGSFALAKNLINLMMTDKDSINFLLRPWATRIIEKKLKNESDNLKEKEISVASSIKRLFIQLSSENSNVKSAEIIEIAEDALNSGFKTLAKELLKIENPSILKIGFFLKMEDFDSALEESINCLDSFYIYLILKKFFTYISKAKKSQITTENLVQKIQNLNQESLIQHLLNFLNYLDHDDKPLMIRQIDNDDTFFLNCNINELLQTATKFEAWMDITQNSKRKKMTDKFQKILDKLDETNIKARKNNNKIFSSFIEKKMKLFYYYLVISRDLNLLLISKKFLDFRKLSPKTLCEFIIESDQDFHSSKKFKNSTLKEFEDSYKGGNWLSNLSRLKILVKRKDFETATEFIKSHKLAKVNNNMINNLIRANI